MQKRRFRLDPLGREPPALVAQFHDQRLVDALSLGPRSQLQNVAIDEFRAVERQPPVDAALDLQPASGGAGNRLRG